MVKLAYKILIVLAVFAEIKRMKTEFYILSVSLYIHLLRVKLAWTTMIALMASIAKITRMKTAFTTVPVQLMLVNLACPIQIALMASFAKLK